MRRFPGKLALQQRLLPGYRVPFFDLLASACDGGLSLFAGQPRPGEGITTAEALAVARYKAGRNVYLFGGSLTLYYQRGLTDWLRAWNPDALIVEANWRDLSLSSGVRWMHRRGRPVVGWGLGAPPPPPSREAGHLPQNPKERVQMIIQRIHLGFWGRLGGGRFLQRRRLSFLQQFDALIAYSQRGADEYAQLGFPKEKIFVAQNAVSPPPSFPLPFRASTLRHALTGSQGKLFDPSTRPDGQSEQVLRLTVLFVGRLQARKRIDLLLRACAQLEAAPRLVIIGDGPERRTLESLAREVYPGTEFIGARHGVELKPYFTEADLFVLPGTGGLAIQEAMSYGLPVIVAQGDGTQDDLVRKENGWQIPPDDLTTLVSTMKEALSDVARLRRMGKESYRIVKEEINIEKMAETFINVLSLTVRK